jgi:competence protein ComEC
VTLYADHGVLRAPACGEELAGELRMKTLERYRDAGAWQYADYAAGLGVGARASTAAGALRVVGPRRASWGCRLGAAQAWASGRLLGYVGSGVNRQLPPVARLSVADGRMLDAMLFGDRTSLDQGLRTGFERTGTFHLFVVSGLHIALLAGGVFWVLRRVRLPVWAATVGTIAAAAGYAAMTGFGQPVQRSLGMVTVYLLARVLGREREPLQALGAAALAMLLWAPASLFEAGFQMTVLAVVAIGGIGHPLAERWFVEYGRVAREVFRPRRRRLEARLGQLRLTLELFGEALAGVVGWRWLRYGPAWAVRVAVGTAELALLGMVTELVMALPMALYFHRAVVFALPANMVVLPVIGVLAPAAVATFVGAVVHPWLAAVPGAVTALLLHGIGGVIGRISGMRVADLRVPGPGGVVTVVVLGVLGGCCWAVRRGRGFAWAAVGVLPGVAALVLWPRAVERRAGAGKVRLVEAGGPVGRAGGAEVVSGFDVGEEVVSPYLWSRGVRRVDVVVLTHAHTDHMGGMPAVLRNFRPRELWVGIDPGSRLYRALLAEAGRLGITVRHLAAEDAMRWDGVDVYCLSPAVEYRNAGAPRNDDSVVLRLQYGRASALLEGDAERASEAAMVADGRVGPVTLLKVGHHGSASSSTAGFLAEARPVDAVVSDGRGNPFGHPRAEVIDRIAAGGAHVFRVDEFGATSFFLTRDGRISEWAGFGDLTHPAPP